MPEIKFETDWLKANNNVKNGDRIKFLNAGEQDKDGNWVFEVEVVSTLKRKKFSLNKKNFKSISDAYGTNSDNWVGKEMQVVVIQTENPKGDLVDAIRLRTPGHQEEEGVIEVDEEVEEEEAPEFLK